jgi:NADH-quinone oxidoreductase subunit C
MEAEEVLDRLRERFGDSVKASRVVRPGVAQVAVPREAIHPLCQFLKDDLGFDHCSLISAVDWVNRFECVYQLASWGNRAMVQVNAIIPHDDPRIRSVADLWNGANWHEREAYDMMGIVFEGHPDLRRILLPRDFKFFPLRKDYKGE